MKTWFSEFKAFISKGNAIDLAVGIVIGGAFNTIIKSFVSDIIMPLISLLAKSDITKLYVILRGTATYDAVAGALILSQDAVLLRYGSFLQSIMDFLIVALAIFLALKIVVAVRKRLDSLKNVLNPETPEEIKADE